MNIRIVLGKNFGDEGKGLATDYFAQRTEQDRRSCLVVRFNGGAQAGHTVDLRDRRFVFHQLSSGSFRNADTLWADPFLPDLYKLREEEILFSKMHGKMPRVFSFGNCRCVTIDDVLINMALERSRGAARHGSCGMGINEAVLRSKRKAFCVTLSEIRGMTGEALFAVLKNLRAEYTIPRLREVGLTIGGAGELGELLTDENVLRNAAEEMCRGAESVRLITQEAVRSYEEVIFEGAQGLLLDENYLPFAPHLTSSRTGFYHPRNLCSVLFPNVQPEVIYVTRAYVTRHGSGPLPHEDRFTANCCAFQDRTNVPNEWQGKMRFAPHGNAKEFSEPVLEDLSDSGLRPSLMLTHLNETDGRVCTAAGDIPVRDWCEQYDVWRHFQQVYLSDSPFSEDVTVLVRTVE